MAEKTCRHHECVSQYAAELALKASTLGGGLLAAVDAHLGTEPVPCIEEQMSRITARPPALEESENGKK